MDKIPTKVISSNRLVVVGVEVQDHADHFKVANSIMEEEEVSNNKISNKIQDKCNLHTNKILHNSSLSNKITLDKIEAEAEEIEEIMVEVKEEAMVEDLIEEVISEEEEVIEEEVMT